MAPDPRDHDDTATTQVGSTSASPADALADPAVLAGLPHSGRYQLGAELGAGGMGEVLSARDTHLGREVAVKRLRAARPTADDLGRFLREARIQGRLDHPAIVPIHDLALDDAGRPFFSMKQLAGVTLHHILYQPASRDSVIQVWSRARLLRAFVEVCLAIEFAHTRGVIHRDLKPGNIVLGDFGEVYVLDWGVARVLGEGPDTVRSSATSLLARAEPVPDGPTTPVPSAAVTIDAGATAAGAVLGTPGYMAPEQIRGDATVGPAADIYALGCILFELLAGEALHPRGIAALTTTLAGVDGQPSLRAPGKGISPELDAICAKATALDPAARFLSARALGEAVQGYLDGDRDVALRRELAAKQLAVARAEAGDGDGDDPDRRRRVMRAASAALALDPDSREASELISTLLLEPPARVPPEVRDELARSDEAYTRRHARFGLFALVAYTAFLPAFLWVGVVDWRYLGAGYGILLVNTVWSMMTAAHPHPPVYRAWVTSLFHVAVVAIFGHGFGSWTVAPGLAAISLAILANHPHLRATWALTLLFAAAVLGPWGLEAAGLIQKSYLYDPRGFVVRSPAVLIDEHRGPVMIFAWTVGLVVMSSFFGRRIARTRFETEVRYATQAWQLRQLVPEITSAAAKASG